MKKGLLVLLAALLAFAAGCGGQPAGSAGPPAITQQELDTLVAGSFDCMANIFVLNTLYRGEWPQDPQSPQDHLVKADSQRFEDFAALEAYVRGIYVEETADRYLYHYPEENAPLYHNREGEIFVDLMAYRPKGYFVDWQQTVNVVESCQGDVCTFRVETQITEPAEVPAPEPYVIEGTALYRDGRWLLTGMLA